MEAVEKRRISGIRDDAKIELIPMREIFADDDFNCRGEIPPIDVVELAKNIREIGLAQPIILQRYSQGPPGTIYRIVAGYRRHKAHIVNNATHIKSIIAEGLSDTDAKLINLSENLNRKDLNLLQESKAVNELLRQGLTQMEMAERLRVSRGWVQIRLYTLKLPTAIQEDVRSGFVRAEHVMVLHNLPEKEQYEIVKAIKDRKADDGSRARVKISKKTLKKDKKSRMKREPKMIERMMEHILDNIGGNFGTRCLAWACGNITTEELYEDIAEIAAEEGKTYFPPSDDISCQI